MIKLLNAILVLTLLISGFFLYSLEHTTRGLERHVAKLKSDISAQRESIKLLNAEWSSLTRPERLQKLAEEQLKLVPVTASQQIAISDLAGKIPDTPILKIDDQNADPIGAILEKMQ